MTNDNAPTEGGLHRALGLMRNALSLLDESGAPAEVGAHLDMAIISLRAIVSPHSREPDSQSSPAHS